MKKKSREGEGGEMRKANEYKEEEENQRMYFNF
jgi:hypothetical protein